MIELAGVMGIPLLKKTRFTGSDGKLRYVLEKRSSEEEGDRLAAVWWCGELCFDATPEEEKKTEFFPFTAEGIRMAQEWLNSRTQQ